MIVNTPKRKVKFVILEPIHYSWMVRVNREYRSAHKPFNEYYGVSRSSVRRIENLMNQDKVHLGTVTLSTHGRAEIELFPKY